MSLFAAPFDRLKTTRAYALRIANLKREPQLIVRSNPESGAAALGMRFGVLGADEVAADGTAEVSGKPVLVDVVERIEPGKQKARKRLTTRNAGAGSEVFPLGDACSDLEIEAVPEHEEAGGYGCACCRAECQDVAAHAVHGIDGGFGKIATDTYCDAQTEKQLRGDMGMYPICDACDGLLRAAYPQYPRFASQNPYPGDKAEVLRVQAELGAL